MKADWLVHLVATLRAASSLHWRTLRKSRKGLLSFIIQSVVIGSRGQYAVGTVLIHIFRNHLGANQWPNGSVIIVLLSDSSINIRLHVEGTSCTHCLMLKNNNKLCVFMYICSVIVVWCCVGTRVSHSRSVAAVLYIIISSINLVNTQNLNIQMQNFLYYIVWQS